ncbi:cytochrome bd oxidase subunit II [Deferribacter desulfuricans SSM1]|uniref:Cytochrome bd oxidase subunit II n=1 Tax=Deferribacter desulfuricans (strain DSM 14783 / JCM 11476 / NBRC 101012 / SSM1) TaxID=639282 RepID=D3P8N8_DEFDS|nr:cytochrome d ubiquinol oxidase subunit II [Deferribacter desulfuricans]BAI81078.1 cytochrome bd oxidase subunit II [Deferribacter desulfuricans SSM1]
MVYQIIWFALWGLLWAVYFMLDGFDFGAGILHPFLGKSDEEKRMIINTLGPVWDGNEVWLITAGGATFAAFPTTYAYMFSYLYTPLLIILFALIFRGVAFEFRGKGKSEQWKKLWDVAIFAGSLIPTILFGVAFGNIFQGLPIDANGYHGSLAYLLNPYGILTGLFFLLLFLEHGALWLAIKTTGELPIRAKSVAKKVWPLLVAVAVIFLIFSAFKTHLYDNYLKNLVWFIVPIIAVIALLAIFFFTEKSPVKAFFASCITILAVVFTGIIGLYPNLIPSSIDPKYSLTAFNSSSSPYTLKIMTIVVIIFVPIVLLYQIWTYKIFKDPVTPEEINDPEVETY